ncbi:MAG: anaerobic ribonucleoside-triphosphate reductase activating protein [Planctomycetaceae bacterium]|jgi:anaerobic ribonucleoside-triphosphate reductase activating protein|nr:anaerobic ribonucleoside-triphosphate reductase activating protein [Planctomycetaceae bacterium]
MSDQRSIIRIAGVVPESVTDGPGVRFVIFVQGCERHCLGCHNPHTHDPDGGYEIEVAKLLTMIKTNPLLNGVTLSGGEPFLQAARLANLARQCHELGLSVVTYTGYQHEELLAANYLDWQELLQQTDVLIDSPFVQDQATAMLPFRGSQNQRMIQLREF